MRPDVLEDLTPQTHAIPGEDWLHQVRDQGRDRFEQLGFPTTKHEEWRFTNVGPIAHTAFKLAERGATVDQKLLEPFLIDPAGPLLTIVDGHFRRELSRLTALRGVVVTGLGDALEHDADLVRGHLGQHADVNDAFTALSTAHIADGAFVHIAQDAKLDRPVHLLLMSTAGHVPRQAHPRNLVVAEQNSSAAIVEHYVSVGDGGSGGSDYWTNAVTEAWVGPGARLRHYYVEEDDERRGLTVGTLTVRQERGSDFESHTALFGGALVRNNVHVHIAGAGAKSLINGLFVARGRQHMDNHMRVVHAAEHCDSRQFYKGILADQSRGVFTGRIIVRPGAQKTDAKQTSRNLLLSDDAQVNAQPQLEIYADDVKCTHGATTGPLDADALFYLRTRGIDEPAARAMLIHAFASESLGRMGDPDVRAYLERRLTERLNLERRRR